MGIGMLNVHSPEGASRLWLCCPEKRRIRHGQGRWRRTGNPAIRAGGQVRILAGAHMHADSVLRRQDPKPVKPLPAIFPADHLAAADAIGEVVPMPLAGRACGTGAPMQVFR